MNTSILAFSSAIITGVFINNTLFYSRINKDTIFITQGTANLLYYLNFLLSIIFLFLTIYIIFGPDNKHI